MKTKINFAGNRLLLFVLIFVILVMGILDPRIFQSRNLQTMAFQLPELGLLSLAMMITMLTGGINLSIISGANLSGIITGMILLQYGSGEVAVGTIAIAVLAGLIVSILLGAFNGWLIAYIKIPAILATLGTMTLVKGISILLTRGSALSGLIAIDFIGNGSIFGIPVPLLLFIIGTSIMAIILSRTPTGFELYMIGSNTTASRYSGIKTKKILFRSYIISNLFSGIAAMVMISRFNSAKADYGESYLLVTVLAVVLGGTSAAGGSGKVSGLVLSLIILQIISSSLNILRINAFLTVALWGFIILLVMSLKHIYKKH